MGIKFIFSSYFNFNPFQSSPIELFYLVAYKVKYFAGTVSYKINIFISVQNGDSDRLISAVVAALCSPTVRLRSTFPILNSPDAPDYLLRKALSPSDNSGLTMMPGMDAHHYPILVEQMSYRNQVS